MGAWLLVMIVNQLRKSKGRENGQIDGMKNWNDHFEARGD